jgi:predicted DNA binding CopG/RHH family protein
MDWNGKTKNIRSRNIDSQGLRGHPEAEFFLSSMPFGDPVMNKKSFVSLAHAKRAAKSAKPAPDSEIDFRDMPEATDEQLKRARRVGRPATGHAKHLIAIRMSPNLLARLRRLAAKKSRPYQMLIHEILERATRREVA